MRFALAGGTSLNYPDGIWLNGLELKGKAGFMKRYKRGLCAAAVAMALALGALGFLPAGAWAQEDPAFAVIDTQGNETQYTDRLEAQRAMKDGYTFKLLKDYSGEWGIKPSNGGKARDIIVDLNGFSVTCTKATNGRYAISVEASYGGARNCTATIKNSGSKQSVLTSFGAQILSASGDSGYSQVVNIEGDIAFKSLNEGREPLGINLGTGAKLLDTPAARLLVPNGGFSVKEADGNSYLYGSFGNASRMSSDGLVTMVNNYTGNEILASGSRNATLDLAGHTYTYMGNVSDDADAAIDVNYPNVTLTVKNGTVVANAADGVKMTGAPNEDQMNNRGLVLDGVKLTASGSDAYGIVTNGTEVGNTVTLRNSMVEVPNGYGIYFPSAGSVIIDSSTVSAKYVGVQMCAGSLSIVGDSVISTSGEPQAKTEGDGPIADGAAISVVNREGYKDLGSVTIENGTFNSAAGVDAVKAYSFNNADKTESEWAGSTGVVDVSGGAYPDTSALKFAGDRVALKTDRGFSIMPETQALDSGAVASVTTNDGSTVYFLSKKEAEDFVASDGELGKDNIKPVTYTVDFDLNGGTGNAGKHTVEASTAAMEPKDPSRSGYQFLGWYADGAQEPYDFSAPVTANLTLTAKWVKVWNVTFVYGNGDEDAVAVVREGDTVARPSDPILKGWEFAGWFTVKNSDGTLAPASEYDFSKPVTGDLKLYGGWTEVAEGESGQGNVEVPTSPADKPADKPAAALPKTGDASMFGVAVMGAAGTLAAAAGYVASKRRK